MEEDFNFIKNSDESISDIKDYLFRVLAHWKWFLVTIPIGLAIAYYINISTQKQFGLSATISITEKQNPLFSSGTSIAFNWGGVSDKVEGVRRYLSSRTHNEAVVKELQFYIEYLKKGQFRNEDVYGKTPFKVILEPNQYQLLNTLVRIDFTDDHNFNLTVNFEDKSSIKLINYDTDEILDYSISNATFSQQFSLDEELRLPFLNLALQSIREMKAVAGSSYMIRFKSVNSVVGSYQRVRATPIKNTSLLNVTLVGPNKKRIVDYLNKTVEVLSENQLKDKTNYAYQTLEFIDQQFENTKDSLRLIEDDLGEYKQEKGIYNLSSEGAQIFTNTASLDQKYYELVDQLEYYQNLENYIKTHHNFTSIPAPAMVNVIDGSISSEVGALTQLSAAKIKLESEVTSSHPSLVSLNQEIVTAKNVLLENISSLKKIIELDIKNSERRLDIYNSQLQKLPEKEQQLLNYERKYIMTENNYKYLLQKRYEADIAIAASVSDITILDKAKDTGQQSNKPRTGFNYMVGILLSIILPLFIIVAKEIFDTKIQTVENIEKLSPIPVLGVVGRNDAKNNLAVVLKPKSSVAEAFRALRSNIHFLFSRSKIGQTKTVVITSSVGGEGKTFVSINMATVFAMSGKKTILVGLDLRKPKIFGDFELKNDVGVVNYLIGQKTKEEIIQKTHVENLDMISAGPIPPNPSELIMSTATDELIDYLKDKYEYIILDTPPIGLVADAFELVKYADVTLYVVRQSFTQKGMLKMINDKYMKKEISNVSIVLNDFKVKAGFGYGYGYGYGYGQGYQEEEKKSFFKRIFKKL
ncbi:MAG: polysaccharide biosynthesis tyrosine autokinase [Urechidicola sp.]|nr:polysaccharide biosynthesis tyrosine autokinase [Urechidicola sp.]